VANKCKVEEEDTDIFSVSLT